MTPPLDLIAVLLDGEARWDERDDAALQLADHHEPEVVQALIRVMREPQEDETLRATCAASVGEIEARSGHTLVDFDDVPESLRAEAAAAFNFGVVSRLLLRHWDPLGMRDVDVHPDSEYRREAQKVLELLEADGQLDDVARYLTSMSTELEGSPNQERSRRAAEAVTTWWSTGRR